MTHALPAQLDFIDGTWRAPTVARAEWIEHASTGAPVQQQVATDAAGVEAALAAAWRVHDNAEWSGRSAADRADALDALGATLAPMVPDIAANESATSGAIIGTTSMLGFIVHGAFHLAAQMLRAGTLSQRFDGPAGPGSVEVERLPWGPALLLCPWNAPAPMAAHKMASALAAGCPVIIKPPERAPHGSAALAAGAEQIGLPRGLVQLVHGGPDVATTMMTDRRIRAVSFTGGIVGGRAVAHACAEGLKPAQLELGGHSPLVILPNAAADDVAAAAVGLLTTLNGQWCRALGRLIVPAARHDELVDAVLTALADVRIGDPLDPSSQMGPIVHSAHLASLRALVDRLAAAGGQVHARTPLPSNAGNWMAPTVVTGLDPANSADEMFGPIAAVHTYDTIDQAVALANGTDYGLEAYVVGDADDNAGELAMHVARRIRAGGVKVNGVSPISLSLMAPRPAFGISGLHDEGTAETIHFFGGNRVVGVENSLRPPAAADDASHQGDN
jgi:acyl-CoA reductase-like NAD-dependent aldehyde dehydrogenase